MLFKNISVVTPVFNDWESLEKLIDDLSDMAKNLNLKVNLIAVNDCSTTDLEKNNINPLNLNEIKILQLASNLGHQRAIAIGLIEAHSNNKIDGVVVLDCDGEDKVSDIPKLIEKINNYPIVVASRKSRNDSASYKFFYRIYKIFFKLLVGELIDFGNFCFIPRKRLVPLVYAAGIWNNLGSKIIQSRLPLKRVYCSKGVRYKGKSKVNFSSALVHGLGAMSVFIDVILARIILVLSFFIAILILTFIGGVFIRLATTILIPGQATTILGLILIALIQSVLLVFITVFLALNLRSIKDIVPAIDGKNYIVDKYVVKRN